MVSTCVLLAAVWVGSLFGSGALSAQGRFNAERVAAQSGQMSLRGTPAIPGHPGELVGLSRQDMIRKFIALDAVN